jgi:hypothetical protein
VLLGVFERNERGQGTATGRVQRLSRAFRSAHQSPTSMIMLAKRQDGGGVPEEQFF